MPDVNRLRRSLLSFFAVQVQPMFGLQCALEENCLGRRASLYGPDRQGHIAITLTSPTLNLCTTLYSCELPAKLCEVAMQKLCYETETHLVCVYPGNC